MNQDTSSGDVLSLSRTFDGDHDAVASDEFDSELFAMSTAGLSIEELLGVVETRLGFDAGGSWWLAPDRLPVEVVDSQGTLDEGAIVDVEAEVRSWLRDSFDRNPEYAEHSYHLLDRLEELSRLNGLVAEVSLSKVAARQRLAPNSGEVAGTEGDYHMVNGREIFHSTLSLAPGGEYDQVYNTYKRDGSLDMPRSVGGLQSHVNRQLHAGAADAVRRAHQPTDKQVPRRVPLAELTVPPPSAGDLKGGTFSRPPRMPQLSKLAVLPQLQKSQQPPLPSPRHPGTSRIDGRPETTGLSSANVISTPKISPGTLYRTYSKEQLKRLKDDEQLQSFQSQPFLQTAGNLLRSSALTYSLANSDRSVGDDLTRSFDKSAQSLGVPLGGTNPLSLSMSAAETGDSIRGSNWTAASLSGGVRNSLSVIRSTDIYEMARQQESNLRKHHSGGGSRGQLTGSNNSLTESVLVVPQGQSAGSYDSHSEERVHQSLDVSLVNQENRLRSSNEQIGQAHSNEIIPGNADPHRKLSTPAFTGALQYELGMKPLSVMDKAASQLEALRASRDHHHSKMSLSRDGTLLTSSNDSFKQSVDNIGGGPLTKPIIAHHGGGESEAVGGEGDQHFFPSGADTPDAVTPDDPITPLPVVRLSSQKLFEQLEAKLTSGAGTFVERVDESSLPGVGVSYDLTEATMAVPDAPASSHERTGAVAASSSRNSSSGRASGLPRFTRSGIPPPNKSGHTRIPGFSNPIKPLPTGYQRTGIPTVTIRGGATRLSRSRDPTVKEQTISGLKPGVAGHPRVHQSDSSPVRSAAMRKPRLGKQVNANQPSR